MSSRAKAPAAVLAALLATLLAAGCGESEIDVAKASKFIDDAVTKQVGAEVKSVKCPDSVETKAKATFTCVVTGSDGTKGDARLTQKDDEGNLAFYAPFLHTKEAAKAIQTELRNRSRGSRGAIVSCPEIVIAAKGRTFDCRLTVDGEQRKVVARQTDAGGNFTYRVAAG